MKPSALRTEVALIGRSPAPAPRGASAATAERRETPRLTAVRRDPVSVSIVSINYAPEMTGIGVYTAGLARFLGHRGHAVTVHTGFPYYPAWRKEDQDRRTLFREYWEDRVRVRRSYLYVPSKPSVARRIVHELSFVASSVMSYLLAPRTDATIIVSPPLFLGIPVALVAWLKGSKVLFHVQDLQPDAALELGMLRKGLVSRVLYGLEKITYRVVQKVSAISPGMLRRIEGKGLSSGKLVLFRNWADDQVVTPRNRDTVYRKTWDLGNRFVVMYAGNLGLKQGLETVLEAAAILRDREDVVFVIVGDGGQKDDLMELARARGLGNVMFKPLQPLDQLSELLATADVGVVPQRRAVSDIVLPSKVSNILGSGRPVIVAADPGTDLHQLVTEGECGIAVDPGNAGSLADAIGLLHDDPNLRTRFGRNARRAAEHGCSSTTILDEFEGWLCGWIRGAHKAPAENPARVAVAPRDVAEY